jgi:hypothetical protein
MEARQMNPNAERAPALRPCRSRSRTAILCALALGAAMPGCTSRRLQINTAHQAQTVVDLQYRQILDNLAMYCLNPTALPSMMALKTGASQVGDTGSVGFLGATDLMYRWTSNPNVAGTRTVVDQWGTSPLTDDDNLMLVRKAFRSALGYPDLIDEDDANDLAHDLAAQVGTTADMSVDRDTLGHIFSQNIVSGTLARFMPPEPSTRNPPPETLDSESLARAQRRHLDQLAYRLAWINDLISRDITDTLDDKIMAQAYAFDYASKIDVELLKSANELYDDAENWVFVVPVKGGLRFRIFDGKREPAYDIQVMPSVPDVGNVLAPDPHKKVIVIMVPERTPDHGGKHPHVRIYGAAGTPIAEGEITDPNALNALLSTLANCLNDENLAGKLSDSEKTRIIAAVRAADDSTREQIDSTRERIEKLQKTYERAKASDPPTADDKREILKGVVGLAGLADTMKKRFEPVASSATGQAKEVIHRLNDTQKTLDEVRPGWFRVGPKPPKDACYVGHACFCGQQCYVWVCREGMNDLAEFTRKVLKLGTTVKDVQVVTAPTGIQFSPALSNPTR